MNDQATLISSDLHAVDEAELTRVVQTRVESVDRRSVHPADRVAAAHLPADVVRVIQGGVLPAVDETSVGSLRGDCDG
jgi:hypothetical protein